MEQGRSSQTAMICALLRAAHVMRDSKPFILADELAARLIGLHDQESLDAALSLLEKEVAADSSAAAAQTWMEIGRSSIAVRSRYSEDALESAISRGVSQYVVLGAGFDSFAYRRRDLVDRIRIFEVDHPDTQERKLQRLAQLQIPLAANAIFVPINFEKEQSIVAQLEAKGYRHDQPALISWLGVVWYLSDESIDRVFAEIASAAPGSELVLDYLVPEHMLDDLSRQMVQVAERIAARRGEQGRRYFEPAQMAERLRSAGFGQVQDVGPQYLNDRYFSARTDKLRLLESMHLVSAHVLRSPVPSSQPLS